MDPNWLNRSLFHGDNLDVMLGMNSGSVDLIVTEPPFNQGRNFVGGAPAMGYWVWSRDCEEWSEWCRRSNPKVGDVVQLVRSVGGNGMGAYLAFMSVRLLEMSRVLSPSGTMYLHCEANSAHYVRMLLDAVFGQGACPSEIVWPHSNRPGAQADTIFVVSRHAGDLTVNSVWSDMSPMHDVHERRPIEMYKRFTGLSSNEGEVVFDPFCGAGASLLAAEEMQRKWIGVDVDRNVLAEVETRFRNFGVAVQVLTDKPEREGTT